MRLVDVQAFANKYREIFGDAPRLSFAEGQIALQEEINLFRSPSKLNWTAYEELFIANIFLFKTIGL